jgi:hypothetical protein
MHLGCFGRIFALELMLKYKPEFDSINVVAGMKRAGLQRNTKRRNTKGACVSRLFLKIQLRTEH